MIKSRRRYRYAAAFAVVLRKEYVYEIIDWYDS